MQSLVRPETGWLAQHPELVARVPESLTARRRDAPPEEEGHQQWIVKHAKARTPLEEALRYVRDAQPGTAVAA
jgi:hypothetical protein